jgi:hypothetical protein
MKQIFRLKKMTMIATGLVLLPVLLGGCSWIRGLTTGSPADKSQNALYYDFGDVMIPAELKIDKDESFVYKAPGLSAGVLVLKGRVERLSLINFFESNMVKDKWTLVSSFKSPRTMILFHKENRWCVINITDRAFDYHLHVEIWVSPTSPDIEGGILDESGLLK